MEMNLSRLKTVEIKVQMDCQCLGCERKVKKSVKGMEGVTHVEVKPEQGKLTVTGFVDPDNLLERVRRRTRKKAEFWPRPDEPYGDVVPHPYAPEPYNVNALAPPGYMRNMLQDPEASALARANFFEEVNYTTPFSEENPNACSVM